MAKFHTRLNKKKVASSPSMSSPYNAVKHNDKDYLADIRVFNVMPSLEGEILISNQ
jgi:hypothetical protein